MPCWEIRETTVDMSNADPKLLAQAMEGLGVSQYQYSVVNGVVKISGWQRTGQPGAEDYDFQEMPTANQIKVAYAQQAVAVATKRFGWKVNQAKSTARKIVVNKR